MIMRGLVAAFVPARQGNGIPIPPRLLLGTTSVPERPQHPGAHHSCRLNPTMRGDLWVLANAETKKAAWRELMSYCRLLLPLFSLGSCLAWTHEGNSSLWSFVLYESSCSIEDALWLAVNF